MWQVFDEAIEMRQRRFQYFPSQFVWRGQRYVVQRVDRCWSVSRRGWRGRIERHCFEVACEEGTFELHQELRANSWRVHRARFAGGTASAVWRTVMESV
jgi:hypothetical protein